MVVSFEIEGQPLRVTKNSFADDMRMLEERLEPGIPVLVQSFTWNDATLGGNFYVRRKLFFSDGTLEEGVFGIQKGKRNVAFANLGEDPSQHSLHYPVTEAGGTIKVSFPGSWTMPQCNEGTFSNTGPHYWTSHHSSGTESVVIGRNLTEHYTDALLALQFARDAVRFKLDPFYAMQGYLVTEIGDGGGNQARDQRRTQGHRLASLRATQMLVREARRELEDRYEAIEIGQLGWWRSGAQPWQESGYPLHDTDYIIVGNNPRKVIGFVKVDGADTYFLPKDGCDALVELAFSPEHVKKFYPYGMG
jgi:hypothetical protein